MALGIENVVLSMSADDVEVKSARRAVRRLLQEYSGIEIDNKKTLVDTISDITLNGKKDTLRTVSLMVLRLLSIPEFFPKNTSENKLESKIITLVEPQIGDMYKRFGIDIKEQTYEKIEKLYGIHLYCCEKLTCLNQCPPKIETISAEKQIILRAVGDATVKSYLQAYEFTRIRASIEAILTQLVNISESADALFVRRLKDLSDLLSDELSYCEQYTTFVTNNYYRPFLESVSEALETIAQRSKARFVCTIKSRKGPQFTIDKKYPLHRKNTDVRLLLPLTNSGPGIAEQVMFDISANSNSILILTEQVELGSVGAGDFVVPVTIHICDPVESIILDVIMTWRVIGKNDDKIGELTVNVEAQKTDIDWDSLRNNNPYSLDIARGKNFYGRKDSLDKLFSRVSQARMNSSYITGQRRVGKSSLAKAVEDKVVATDNNCHVLNIECGDFKHPDALGTINSLGENIEYFLMQHLPAGVVWERVELNGSLALISRLLGLLERAAPQMRFLIIIDEFDEINQDLYRNSEAAQTFFLNIRSLSGKSNMGFILIGAEKMSFVMSSQGEKLNKFDNITLDTFNQDDEWQDYENLVMGNIKDQIVWHDNAIRALYAISNGHPYFTKQICSMAYARAVKSKDAEIAYEEIQAAVEQLITELEVNSFQHYWRDGIQGGLEEMEILALKRCRVLVGVARAKRLGMDVTAENIVRNIHSVQLPEADVLPILTDYCRRKIMREGDRGYTFVVPLFERWLINEGFNHLIADQLGDELAEKRQEKEDLAYVQDTDISDMLTNWPMYRGLQITLYEVRNWLSQVDSHVEQRLLFKLLNNLRFFGEAEIRSALKTLHERVRSKIPVLVTTSKAQRRKDIWVTYVDGPAKSGAQFAALYAEENLISTTCVKEISEINALSKQNKPIPDEISTIIIVDDFIGSGGTLSSGIGNFYETNNEIISAAKITVSVVAICATPKGEDMVRKKLSKLDVNADLEIYETLGARHFAFSDGFSIWEDKAEMYVAKNLCQQLGVKIDRARPLGYAGEGLLVVFSRNCPNNTLPIIHSPSRGSNPWRPLFSRIKH